MPYPLTLKKTQKHYSHSIQNSLKERKFLRFTEICSRITSQSKLSSKIDFCVHGGKETREKLSLLRQDLIGIALKIIISGKNLVNMLLYILNDGGTVFLEKVHWQEIVSEYVTNCFFRRYICNFRY